VNGYVIFATAAGILLNVNAVGSFAVARSDLYDSRRKAVLNRPGICGGSNL
jgi:hypothetical protein